MAVAVVINGWSCVVYFVKIISAVKIEQLSYRVDVISFFLFEIA